jgi:uncharacterized protein (DUF1501 family)
MARKITRRQFLKRSAVGAVGAAAAPYMRVIPGTNVSYAAGPSDAIVVVVQLDGGNDGVNTVYPLNDFGGNGQRTTYEDYRSTLKLPKTNGELASSPYPSAYPDATQVLEIGANADGSDYALHPAMKALHGVYQANKMAVVHGVHYPFPDHSHFRSTEIWDTGDPLGTSGLGWFGKYLNYAGFLPTEVPLVNVRGSIRELFTPTDTSIFAFSNLRSLKFPADSAVDFKKEKFRALYEQAAASSPALFPELKKIGDTGGATVSKMEEYFKGDNTGKVEALLVPPGGSYNRNNDLVYDSPLNDAYIGDTVENASFIEDLRHVAATIRADVGARFFHVRKGGFDSHSNQEKGLFHASLLRQISEGVAGLYNDMATDFSSELPADYRRGDLSNKIVIVTFSEFGRTMRQNDPNPGAAGTDHAASAVQFVLGGTVNGGQYGVHPQFLDPRPSNDDDLKFTYDFRDLYGEILSRWLNVPTIDLVGPGKIFAETPSADPDEPAYLGYTPIGFLSP